MPEVTLSIYDRSLLEQIQNHLEAIARHLEKPSTSAPEWYEVNTGLIDIKKAFAIEKSNARAYIFFYFCEGSDDEVSFCKKIDSIEARDVEYERLKKLLMKEESHGHKPKSN